MINDRSSRFYAAPDPSSGAITNTNLSNALTLVDPLHGMAATGVTGLPLSAMQYGFTSPFPDGIFTIYRQGDKNAGFNEYSFNLQNKYTFSEGRLKGLGLLVDTRTYARNRAYYVSYPGMRSLYRLPRATVFNLGVSYSHKLVARYTWSTQVNVQNVLNHYRVWVLPDASNGATLLARLSAQPRTFIWSNSFKF
jgi:hypothetical protein